MVRICGILPIAFVACLCESCDLAGRISVRKNGQNIGDNTRMIRLATLDDASSLAAISLEVWLNTYIRNGINPFFADYALAEFTAARFEKNLLCKNETIWVSQNSEGIDGFIQLSLGTVAAVGSCSDLEISTLYVQPRHQAHGKGKSLLETALKFCAGTGRQNVWLTVNAENERAMRFYIKNGFEKVGETIFQIRDQSYPNHILRCSLLQYAEDRGIPR